jgi:uncharacterized protein YdhG (YjbR/CyaY superfamily)
MTTANSTSQTEAYLAGQSPEFRQAYNAIRDKVTDLFPNAMPAFEYGMPGFRVPITETPIVKWKGTIDPNYLIMGLVQRKRGITFHIWNPNDVDYLQKNEERLSSAGFKVMRGCVEWNRKAAFPVSEVEKMLEDQKRELEVD